MKTHQIILTIFFLLFAVIYDTRYSFAQESEKYPNNSYIEEVPLICNESIILHNFLESKGWKITMTYTGRVGAEATGKPVFIIAHYKNDKLPKSIIETISIQSGQSCFLYKGFDETPFK